MIRFVDDEKEAMRRKYVALERRIRRVEDVHYFASGIASIAAFAVGLFVPFVQATKPTGDDDDSIAILPAVFELAAAGGGPFEGEAILAGAVLGVFALIAIVTASSVIAILAQTTARRVTVARVCVNVMLVGCAGAWLLVLLLAAHFAGRPSVFSPAVFCMTIGAGIAWVTTYLGGERLGAKPL